MKSFRFKKIAVFICILALTAMLGLTATLSQRDDNSAFFARAEASAAWDGTAASGFADGDGAEETPYLISDGAELAFLAQCINDGADNPTYNTASVYYELTNDIVLNDVTSWELWSEDVRPENDWVPIGNSSNVFAANFNGASFSVIGLYINTTDGSQGLFGKVSGAVSGVGVEKNYLKGIYSGGVVGQVSGGGTITNCYNTGSINGEAAVGGVAGYVSGSLINCYNAGDVYSSNSFYVGGVAGSVEGGGTITNCYNMGNVSGGGNYVGGVAGYVNLGGAVTDCYSTGDVSNTGNNTGGVAGAVSEDSTATNCYNTGNVSGGAYDTGGVAGYVAHNSTVTNCYNTGNVSGGSYVGGTMGEIYGGSTITNCYNTGNVSGGSSVGGVTGYVADGSNVINCYFLRIVGGVNGTRYAIWIGDDNAVNALSFGADGVFASSGSVAFADKTAYNVLDALNYWVEENNAADMYLDWQNEVFPVLDIHALNAGEWVTVEEAACTENGLKELRCPVCGEVFDTAVIPALGHDFGDWEVTATPTESETGELTRTCANDSSHTETYPLPMLNTTDYTYSVTTAATCEGTGIGRYTWNETAYGTFYFDVTIPAINHNYGDWEVTATPTESETGELTRTCANDSSHTETYPLPMLNTTDYTYSVTTAATATADGEADYAFEKDGQTFNFRLSIPALGEEPEPEPEYTVSGTETSWNRDSENGFVITVDADITKFLGVKVNGAEISADNYTVAPGSTIVTLNADYLQTLEDGDYAIEIQFTDGVAATTLTITESGEGNPPKGGLSGGAIAGIVIGSVFGAALIGFAIFRFVIKKKNKRG